MVTDKKADGKIIRISSKEDKITLNEFISVLRDLSEIHKILVFEEKHGEPIRPKQKIKLKKEESLLIQKMSKQSPWWLELMDLSVKLADVFLTCILIAIEIRKIRNERRLSDREAKAKISEELIAREMTHSDRLISNVNILSKRESELEASIVHNPNNSTADQNR